MHAFIHVQIFRQKAEGRVATRRLTILANYCTYRKRVTARARPELITLRKAGLIVKFVVNGDPFSLRHLLTDQDSVERD